MVKKFILALFLIGLAGCVAMPQTPAEKGTAGLQAFQVAAVSTADLADDLCTQGLLTQSECDELRELYYKSFKSWVRAEKAFQVWLDVQQDSAWETYLALRREFIGNYETFDRKAASLGVLEFKP